MPPTTKSVLTSAPSISPSRRPSPQELAPDNQNKHQSESETHQQMQEPSTGHATGTCDLGSWGDACAHPASPVLFGPLLW